MRLRVGYVKEEPQEGNDVRVFEDILCLGPAYYMLEVDVQNMAENVWKITEFTGHLAVIVQKVEQN